MLLQATRHSRAPEHDVMSEINMNSPPKLLGTLSVQEFTVIDERHKVLESAELEIAGMLCGPARYLAICRDEDNKGYYLFFCGVHWDIWHDLWFEDLQDVKDYVEVNEYSGSISTWEKMT